MRMAIPIRHLGMTLQVHVGNVAEATAFYATLFGRGPDFASHEDFGEWQVLAGVVAFTNFDDPWGNRLGYCQDIVPSGQQPEPGGNVSDESPYETDPVDRP